MSPHHRAETSAAAASRAAREFSFAFQPIVDVRDRSIFALEALVRGAQGQSAWHVFQTIREEEMHRFDRAARAGAMELAARLGLQHRLSLNCLPDVAGAAAGATPDPVESSSDISLERVILEVTETRAIQDIDRFSEWLNSLRARGAQVAIDDFGEGYSGLNLLAEVQPDLVKIDMKLIRGIERHGPRQAIVRALMSLCLDLGIEVVAEGVETQAEYRWCAGAGICLFQGYYFARPGFECVPELAWPPKLAA